MKKILSLLIIAFFTVSISVAQEKDTLKEVIETDVYKISDVMPQFPGGEIALFKFISDNVIYPAEAKNANITGYVYISFVIETDGSISNVEQAEGSIDIGGGCVEEGIRIVKSMPKWSPSFREDVSIKSRFVLPIEFTLSEKAQKRNKKNKN